MSGNQPEQPFHISVSAKQDEENVLWSDGQEGRVCVYEYKTDRRTKRYRDRDAERERKTERKRKMEREREVERKSKGHTPREGGEEKRERGSENKTQRGSLNIFHGHTVNHCIGFDYQVGRPD